MRGPFGSSRRVFSFTPDSAGKIGGRATRIGLRLTRNRLRPKKSELGRSGSRLGLVRSEGGRKNRRPVNSDHVPSAQVRSRAEKIGSLSSPLGPLPGWIAVRFHLHARRPKKSEPCRAESHSGLSCSEPGARNRRPFSQDRLSASADRRAAHRIGVRSVPIAARTHLFVIRPNTSESCRAGSRPGPCWAAGYRWSAATG